MAALAGFGRFAPGRVAARRNSRRSFLAGALLPAIAPVSRAAAGDDAGSLGVFYFPGWKDRQPGGPSALPWAPIRSFADREPLLGWYDEGSVDVMRRHLEWMAQAGIRFVMFDWYWARERRPQLEHALNAYLAVAATPVSFAIMWANHTGTPESSAQFEAAVRHWIARYFDSPRYLRIDGRPLVMIMLPDRLEASAVGAGTTAPQWLARARAMAREAGHPDLFLVAGSAAQDAIAKQRPADSGYDALSAYNYHGRPAAAPFDGGHRESHSYAELSAAYADHWGWMLDGGAHPYLPPVTAGGDRRPWGGSPDPRHDNPTPTRQEFTEHLRAARALLRTHPSKTHGIALLCCWNEFGEGSFVEPTRGIGEDRLAAISEVFGQGR